MANNQLLAGLINPAYLGGLQQVGQMAGAAPAVSKQRGMLTELYNTAFDPNATQQQFTAAAQQLAAAGKLPEAMEIRTMGQEAISLRKTLESARDRANMEGATAKDKKLYELLKTRSITPEQYSEQLLKEPSVNVTYKEFIDPADNKEKVFKITTNATTGEEIERVPLGAVADSTAGKNFINTAEGSRAYREVVDKGTASTQNVIKYDNLLKDAIEISSRENDFFGLGSIVGGVFGDVKDFLISDVAGLGDSITVHRAKLNEVQMQNAIKLLPRGPASDRDVKLALDASVDPKDLSPEDRIRYIRGMKKIAEAEQEYLQGKIRWIEQTQDPNALGYERYAAVKGLENKIESLKTDYASETAYVDSQINAALQLQRQGKQDEATALIQQLKIEAVNSREDVTEPSPTEVYLQTLEDREAEDARFKKFVEQNNINYL